MTTTSKQISTVWPNTKGKGWPRDLGTQPTKEAIDIALAFARPNTAVAMALAMYARKDGASDSLAATAASWATGRTSATHRVKRDQLAKAGLLVKRIVKNEEGHQVVRIAFPPKVVTKKTRKVRKQTKEATA